VGPWALDAGWRGATIGLGIHTAVAFAWSTVFAVLFFKFGWLRRFVAGRTGVPLTAVGHGTLVWLTMSFAMIPLFIHREPALGLRWLVLLLGRWFFVGIPILIGTADLWRPSTVAAAA
jgi:hypothetical protein